MIQQLVMNPTTPAGHDRDWAGTDQITDEDHKQFRFMGRSSVAWFL
jgi:hypothetical protein